MPHRDIEVCAGLCRASLRFMMRRTPNCIPVHLSELLIQEIFSQFTHSRPTSAVRIRAIRIWCQVPCMCWGSLEGSGTGPLTLLMAQAALALLLLVAEACSKKSRSFMQCRAHVHVYTSAPHLLTTPSQSSTAASHLNRSRHAACFEETPRCGRKISRAERPRSCKVAIDVSGAFSATRCIIVQRRDKRAALDCLLIGHSVVRSRSAYLACFGRLPYVAPSVRPSKASVRKARAIEWASEDCSEIFISTKL